jgi:hypothetical protein
MLRLATLIIAMTAVCSASAATPAREQMIVCGVSGSSTLWTGKVYTSDQVSNRYYVLNDSARTITFVSDGIRQPACSGDCTVQYMPNAIVIRSQEVVGERTSDTETRFDRLAGTLVEINNLRDQDGRVVIRTDLHAQCRPVSPSERRF